MRNINVKIIILLFPFPQIGFQGFDINFDEISDTCKCAYIYIYIYLYSQKCGEYCYKFIID